MQLGLTTTLPDGTRLRVRMPHAADREPLARLLGVAEGDLAVTRLLRFDPRRRAAGCAVVFASGVEHLVAFGSIDLADRDPDVLLTTPEAPPGTDAALADALRRRAERWRRAA